MARVSGEFSRADLAESAVGELRVRGVPARVVAVRRGGLEARVGSSVARGAWVGLALGVLLAWMHLAGWVSLPVLVAWQQVPGLGRWGSPGWYSHVAAWASVGVAVGGAAGGFLGMVPGREEAWPVAEVVVDVEAGEVEWVARWLEGAGAMRVRAA